MIRHLVSQGVRRICLSPGSRSSLLAIEAAENKEIETMVHFDERSMAFHAYGYAKASQEPTAILCTSGSAVANLFPAVMEAYHDLVPLIVITADRPYELYDCMSNQTTDQVRIFGSHVRWETQIPVGDPAVSDRWLAGVIAHAVAMATRAPQGPVHLNCQFREPLRSAPTTTDIKDSCNPHYESVAWSVAPATLQKWGKLLSEHEKGVILVGALRLRDTEREIEQLGSILGWPVCADLLSGARSSASLPHYVDIMRLYPELQPTCVLHLGDRTISQEVPAWIARSAPTTYLAVANHTTRTEDAHQTSHRIVMDPLQFCREVRPYLRPQSGWVDMWKACASWIGEALDAELPPLTEPWLVRALHHRVPPHYAVYFSNSLPVREGNRLMFSDAWMFGQRGVSGIDGNISTAVGIAQGARRPVVAVVGDLAALHDLGALAQLKQSPVPVILLVINNGGGGIFSFLYSHLPTEIFEPYFAGAHAWDMSKAAEMFQIPYVRLEGVEDLQEALDRETTVVIEFFSDRGNNVTVHTNLEQKLRHHAMARAGTVL